MDIVVQRLSKIRELAEVIARINRVPKFFKTAMELPAENTAGCVADHGNVHGNHIPFKVVLRLCWTASHRRCQDFAPKPSMRIISSRC